MNVKQIADAANQYKIFCEQKCWLLLKLVEFLNFMRSTSYPRSCGTPAARVVGLAMSLEDMACLHVYQILDEDGTTKSTTYIMQFLWRDLTSFHVVAPYYSSSGTLEAKFILGFVMETIKLFHLFGFNISLLV